MRVERVTITPDAYRQSQFYAGTHLAMYQINQQQKQHTERPSFKCSVSLATDKSRVRQTPSVNEKHFLQLRQEHAEREEAFQRLAFTNGVNFSTEQQLHLLKQCHSHYLHIKRASL